MNAQTKNNARVSSVERIITQRRKGAEKRDGGVEIPAYVAASGSKGRIPEPSAGPCCHSVT